MKGKRLQREALSYFVSLLLNNSCSQVLKKLKDMFTPDRGGLF